MVLIKLIVTSFIAILFIFFYAKIHLFQGQHVGAAVEAAPGIIYLGITLTHGFPFTSWFLADQPKKPAQHDPSTRAYASMLGTKVVYLAPDF